MLILGSASDIKIAQKAVKVLEEMEVTYDIKVASAHRTHQRIKDIMTNQVDEIEVFITIAGLAAHLPGVIASYTTKPVIAVPVNANLGGIDSLLSSTEMQLGTPVATMGIDRGDNAALLACQILAYNDENVKEKLKQKRMAYDEKMETSQNELIDEIAGEHFQKTKLNQHTRPEITKTLEIPEDVEVLIISENYSNMEIVHKITRTLDALDIPSEYKVIPSTRSPDKLEKYINDVDDQIQLYIAVTGLSSILAGVIVSHTTKPVIGVPCSTHLRGIESLLSMIQMPPGVPTATMGIDAGENAALFVARILSVYNGCVKERLTKFMNTLHKNAYYH